MEQGLLSESLDRYLLSTPTIDSEHPLIVATSRRITGTITEPKEKAVRLFYFVRDEIHYSVYMISTSFDDFKASTILEAGRGYCVQKAVLLAALCRSVAIPSRLVFAKIRNHRAPAQLVEQTGANVFPSHGYCQLSLNDRWINVTPAFDQNLCHTLGVPSVEFDGEGEAVLANIDLSGNRYIDYLEKYEPQADLPFEWLRSRLLPIWGEKRSWLTDNDSRGHRMPLSGYLFPGCAPEDSPDPHHNHNKENGG